MSKEVYIIAEAGVNHNGSLEKARKLIDIAFESGANAVKFQIFNPESLVTASAETAEYQKINTSYTNQLEMLKRVSLGLNDFIALKKYSDNKNIDFLASVFDEESLEFLLKEIDPPLLKIPSGEITNLPFLYKHACTRKKIILSTGMSEIDEIYVAIGVIVTGYLGLELESSKDSFIRIAKENISNEFLKNHLTILHCTSNYPAKDEELNLLAMKSIGEEFHCDIGYSDHSKSFDSSVIATSLGATVLEKHFTIDKKMDGPDHIASLSPKELQQYVQKVRVATKMLGSKTKKPIDIERKIVKKVRKSLVANDVIKKGQKFTEKNISIKRPGNGVSPYSYWELIGRKAQKDYILDELISPKEVSNEE